MKTSSSKTPIPAPEIFLARFAATFVVASFRDRFIHEAIKKPQRLDSRISHSIEEVFIPAFKGKPHYFKANDHCVPIAGTTMNLCPCLWSDLESYIGNGYGVLIASLHADRFYAESESSPGIPYQVYAGP